jgi:hypothetical protein
MLARKFARGLYRRQGIDIDKVEELEREIR